jgi:hypothetical protein
MKNMDLLKRWFWVKRCFWAMLMVTLVINWCPNSGRADSNAITPSDIEYSDPFEITASIMEIDHGKNMLIIAENEIYVVDLMIGTEYIKTVLSDADGRPILFDSLDRGQTVMVRGMKLPDGRVIAEELVQLSSSVENRRQAD